MSATFHAASTRARITATLIALTATAVSAAGGDPVIEWNTAMSAFAHQRLGGMHASHAHMFTLTHAAMSNAIGSISHAPGAGDPTARSAAATEAAFAVLEALIPNATRPFAALRDAQLSASATGTRRAANNAGQASARAMLAQRRDDGWPTILGGGALLASELLEAVEPRLAPRYKPFILPTAAEFQPEVPFWITLGGDLLPVARLRNSTVLDPAATPAEEFVRFWRDEPIVTWNAVARLIVRHHNEPLERNGRLFYLLNCALADGLAAALYWRAEYGEGKRLWVGARAQPEGWHPSFPSDGDRASRAAGVRTAVLLRNYPAVGAVLAGAAQAVLVWFTGSDAADLSAGHPSSPLREIISFSALAKECASAAMMNEGATREAAISGYELGLKIGDYVVRRRT